jgi:hypothetical protein
MVPGRLHFSFGTLVPGAGLCLTLGTGGAKLRNSAFWQRSLIRKRAKRAIIGSHKTRPFAWLAQILRGAKNACSG